MLNEEEDNNKNNNSGLLGSLLNGFRSIYNSSPPQSPPPQNHSTEEEEAAAEKKAADDELKERLLAHYSSTAFLAQAVKEYYSTPASLNKLKSILEDYYHINKGKEESLEFSLPGILKAKKLIDGLSYKDKDSKSLHLVYSPDTSPPKFDAERAISEGDGALKQKWSDTLLNWTKEHATVIDAGVTLEWIKKT